MTLHVNSWLSRSTKLAGRINRRRLPATTIVESIAIEANCVIYSLGANDLASQLRLGSYNSSQLAQ
jgi:hypothetical protein